MSLERFPQMFSLLLANGCPLDSLAQMLPERFLPRGYPLDCFPQMRSDILSKGLFVSNPQMSAYLRFVNVCVRAV